ncbi:hypothetical protein D3C80_2242700 [compost metagenome]
MSAGNVGRQAPGVFAAYRQEHFFRIPKMLYAVRLQECQEYISVKPSSPFKVHPLIFKA